MIAAADVNPQAASVGALQLRLEEPHIMDGVGDVWHVAGLAWRAGEGKPAVGRLRATGRFSGRAAPPPSTAPLTFRAAGGFYEPFFCYCEDVDLAFRLRLMGRGSVRASDAVVRHAGSGITGRASDFTLFHGHRNRIWTYWRNMPGVWLWVFLPYHLDLQCPLHGAGDPAGLPEAYLAGLSRGVGGAAPRSSQPDDA